jgi:transcriptional regulator with XRE-family HTH domain
MNTTPDYMAEPWFAMLQAATLSVTRAELSRRLGVSGPTISQVLNASGLYGTGKASTQRLAERVRHVLGNFECPHLSGQSETPRVISGDQCRAYAHREAPTGSPQDLSHWQSCQRCTHKALTAPPQLRAPVPRGKRSPSPTPMENPE